MNSQFTGQGRALCLTAAAKRLQVPERTLRYRASHGRVQGAFKQGKLWKFVMPTLVWAPHATQQIPMQQMEDGSSAA